MNYIDRNVLGLPAPTIQKDLVISDDQYANVISFCVRQRARGGIFMNKAVAWAIDHHLYNECFYVMACVRPLVLLVIWRLGSHRPENTALDLMLEPAA